MDIDPEKLDLRRCYCNDCKAYVFGVYYKDKKLKEFIRILGGKNAKV